MNRKRWSPMTGHGYRHRHRRHHWNRWRGLVRVLRVDLPEAARGRLAERTGLGQIRAGRRRWRVPVRTGWRSARRLVTTRRRCLLEVLVDFAVVKVFFPVRVFVALPKVRIPDVPLDAHYRGQYFSTIWPQTPICHLYGIFAFPWCWLIKQHLVQLHVQAVINKICGLVRFRDGWGWGRAAVSMVAAPVSTIGHFASTVFHSTQSLCHVPLS